jgi:hypothetical protein
MKKLNVILGVSITMVLTLTAMLLPISASACCGVKPINLQVSDNSPPGVECCNDLVITATWQVTYDDDWVPGWVPVDTGIEVKIYDADNNLAAECIATVGTVWEEEDVEWPGGEINGYYRDPNNGTVYTYTCAKHLPVGQYTYTVLVWSEDWPEGRIEADIVAGEAVVVDTTPPELIDCPGDMVIPCHEEVPEPAEVTATDICDPNPVVDLFETVALGDCDQEYTITRTWVATDASGNESSCTQVISVVDDVAPEVWCEETVNPHGNNTPGEKRSENAKSKAVNPDGFYILLAEDNCDPASKIWVGCVGCMLAYPDFKGFGPFESGTIVKFTEAPGKAPSIKKIGSTNGNAGAVVWHITLPGEPLVFAGDACGNWARCPCFVPPPPK